MKMKIENNWFKKLQMRGIDVLCSKRFEEGEDNPYKVSFEIQTDSCDISLALGCDSEEAQQKLFEKADSKTAENLFAQYDVLDILLKMDVPLHQLKN